MERREPPIREKNWAESGRGDGQCDAEKEDQQLQGLPHGRIYRWGTGGGRVPPLFSLVGTT